MYIELGKIVSMKEGKKMCVCMYVCFNVWVPPGTSQANQHDHCWSGAFTTHTHTHSLSPSPHRTLPHLSTHPSLIHYPGRDNIVGGVRLEEEGSRGEEIKDNELEMKEEK